MDFFSKTIPNAARTLSSWMKKEVSVSWTTIFGGDIGSDRVTASNLMDNDKNWVYVCVDKIADSVSAIPLKLMSYKKDGLDEEVINHPALDLLNKPDEQMTGRDFRYVTMAHLELTGNAYWLKDKTGKPTTLFPLNPKNVTLKVAKDGMSVEAYKYRAGAAQVGVMQEKVLQPDLIIHLKYPNPRNPLVGRGTVEPIAEWVDVDNYATEFNRKFFLNSANFGGAIETDNDSLEKMEKTRLHFENNYKGIQNAHKLLLLPKGHKLNDQGLTPKDMQMKEADSTFRDKILAAFGVPKSVVGIVEDVNRANAESSNYVFMAFTIKPKMDRLVTYLNEFYLPLFAGTEKMYFTYDNPVPENEAISIQENQAALGNAPWMTVNEVRAKKGLAPVDGGDVVMGSSMMTPVGSSVPMDDDESDPTKTKAMSFKKKAAPRVDKVGPVADTLVDNLMALFKASTSNTTAAAIHADFIKRVTHYELEFEKVVKEHDRAQRKDVLAKVKNFNGKKVAPSDLLDKQKEIEKFIAAVTPVIDKLVKEEGERATEYLAKTQANNFLKKEFTMSVRLQEIVKASIKRMARSYTQTTIDFLIQAVNDGIADGDSIDEITDTISKVFDKGEEYRASRIARTEVFSTANDAGKDAYRQSGIVKSIRWKTAADELVCDLCGPMDNKVIGISENFFDKGQTVEGDSGESYDLNYEAVGNPPLHPNCRCFILPEEISVKAMPVGVKKPKVSNEIEEAIDEIELEF